MHHDQALTRSTIDDHVFDGRQLRGSGKVVNSRVHRVSRSDLESRYQAQTGGVAAPVVTLSTLGALEDARHVELWLGSMHLPPDLACLPAVDGLMQVLDPGVVDTLIDAAANRGEVVRSHIIGALSRIDDEQLLRVVLQQLSRGDVQARVVVGQVVRNIMLAQRAVRELASTDAVALTDATTRVGPRALKGLVEALRDPHAATRKSVTDALMRFAPTLESRDTIEDSMPFSPLAGIRQLAELSHGSVDLEYLSDLVADLAHSSAFVRGRAVEGFRKIALAVKVEQQLSVSRGPQREAGFWGRAAGLAAVDGLVAAQHDANDGPRLSAASALIDIAQLGDRAIELRLQGALCDGGADLASPGRGIQGHSASVSTEWEMRGSGPSSSAAQLAARSYAASFA